MNVPDDLHRGPEGPAAAREESASSLETPRRSRTSWLVRMSSRAVGSFLIGGVRVYQVVLSPLLGGQCRFHPSCSQYFIDAVRKYGPVRGSWKGLCRIARCHPFGASGYDPP